MKNNKLILQSQQRFRSEKRVITEEVNNALSDNYGKRIQPINSIERCAYGTRKDLACRKDEIKCNNIIKQYKND